MMNEMTAKDADGKTIRIGCQSWGYDDWVTPAGSEYIFYPPGTKKSEMLAFYSKIFDTVEVDATLYGVPAVSTFRKWHDEAPENFLFSLKFPREITHDRRLSPATIPIMEEFVERARLLKEKLGILLIQLPASFEASKENGQNLRELLSHLPGDIKFAVEFRDSNWLIDWAFEELERNGVTLSLVEGPWIARERMFEAVDRIKTEFVYVRLMGKRDLQKFDRICRPRDNALKEWARMTPHFSAKDLYIYVSNTFEGFAPESAAKLKRLLDIPVLSAADAQEQRSLF